MPLPFYTDLGVTFFQGTLTLRADKNLVPDGIGVSIGTLDGCIQRGGQLAKDQAIMAGMDINLAAVGYFDYSPANYTLLANAKWLVVGTEMWAIDSMIDNRPDMPALGHIKILLQLLRERPDGAAFVIPETTASKTALWSAQTDT